MASPSDIPKIQANINLNQAKATESIPIDKDRKENLHEQSKQQKEKTEKDSIELSTQAQSRLRNQQIEDAKLEEHESQEETDEEPGSNIDIKV